MPKRQTQVIESFGERLAQRIVPAEIGPAVPGDPD